MQIQLNGEEKTIGRHLCVQFRNFYYQAGLQGDFEEYNIYVNDIMYWVYGDLEIYPIIQQGMKVHIVSKNEDPQQALIKDFDFSPGSISRPEKKQMNLFPKSFSSKSQFMTSPKQDKETKPQKDFNQTMPKQLQQIEQIDNNKKEVLVRFPFLLKRDLVIGIQIMKNKEQTKEIFYIFDGYEGTISESDEKISLFQFQKENHLKDQLLEFYDNFNISVYWADQQKQLLVLWPDYTLSYKFIKKQNLY